MGYLKKLCVFTVLTATVLAVVADDYVAVEDEVLLKRRTAPPLQTDWLDLVKGFKGSTVGAELKNIEEGDTQGTRKITVAIPKTAMQHPNEIEEVVVVGRKPEKSEPLLDIRYEWLDDYDNDNYGLVIHLRKDSTWPIRLYMHSEAGYID